MKMIRQQLKKIKNSNVLQKYHQRRRMKLFWNHTYWNVGRFSYSRSTFDESIVKIGDFCSIATNCSIAPGNHPIDYLTTSAYKYSQYSIYYDKEFEFSVASQNNDQVIIGNDVWIGTHAVILNGVTIGDGAIIAAGAVVTKDVPSYEIYGGVPAKKIRDRFSKSLSEKISKSFWWKLPGTFIKSLPQDNIELSLNEIEKYKINVHKNKITVVVTSVIYPQESKKIKKSSFKAIDRLDQTIYTVQTVREKMPKANIILVEGGVKDVFDKFKDLVDDYLYLGNDKKIRKAVDSSNKGLGEASMLNVVYSNMKPCDFVFKLSGRYYLNDNFDLAYWDFNRFNFKNYQRYKKSAYGESKYVEGSHSTRLYGFPYCKISKVIWALKLAKIGLKRNISLEQIFPYFLIGEDFFYQREVGVSGIIGDREFEYIQE